MAHHPYLDRIQSELDKCVTCAVCQSVCPTFQMSGRELLSPRGRIVLLRRIAAGDLDPRDVSGDAYDYCTLCYACQSACPAGVKTDLMFVAARKLIADAKGVSKVKKRVFETLEKPDRVRAAVKAGSLAQRAFGERTVNRFTGNLHVPKLRSKSLVRELPERIEPEGRPRARVAFVPGCMSNYVEAHGSYAAIEVMRRFGAEIVIPKEQVCCGAPAFNNGDFDTAIRLAERNLRLLSDPEIDAVVSPDATCGGAFRHEIPELTWDDDDLALVAHEVAQKTMDWATFILHMLDPRFPPSEAPPVSVTVHDSCHLTHTEGRHRSVRVLLERVPGVHIVEMEEATICCGFGGSFASVYPEDARRWGRRKLDHVNRTGADVGIVSSPGCLNHLQSIRSDQRTFSFRLMHAGELICERMGWSPDQP
ncbi:MAG: Lactate utilization protein A [Calditrichaeota bacterium]|nr:Lactate utilization protein A [Calditrichota bacterium]